MGRRFRPKKKYYLNKNQSAATTGDATGQSQNAHFTAKDEKILFRYLEEYKERAFRVLASSTSSRFQLGEKRKLSEIGDADEEGPAVNIGGFDFPTLTDDLVSKPYLEFPAGLSGKQRQLVHRLCEDGKYIS